MNDAPKAPVHTPTPVEKRSDALLMLEVIWAGDEARECLDELHRRGVPLSDGQIQAAGLVSRGVYEADYAEWWKRNNP